MRLPQYEPSRQRDRIFRYIGYEDVEAYLAGGWKKAVERAPYGFLMEAPSWRDSG